MDVQTIEQQLSWHKVSYLVISDEHLFLPTFIDVAHAKHSPVFNSLIFGWKDKLQEAKRYMCAKGKRKWICEIDNVQ